MTEEASSLFWKPARKCDRLCIHWCMSSMNSNNREGPACQKRSLGNLHLQLTMKIQKRAGCDYTRTSMPYLPAPRSQNLLHTASYVNNLQAYTSLNDTGEMGGLMAEYRVIWSQVITNV